MILPLIGVVPVAMVSTATEPMLSSEDVAVRRISVPIEMPIKSLERLRNAECEKSLYSGDSGILYESDGLLTVTCAQKRCKFRFDAIVPASHSQDEFFGSLLNTFNEVNHLGRILVCLLGKSGSGKTVTLLGDQNQAGVLELLLKHLSQSSSNTSIKVAEITRHGCADILKKNGAEIVHSFATIDSRSIKGMRDIRDVLNCIRRKRATSATARNHVSSRSHLICQISAINGLSRVGVITLCDFAGNEASDDGVNVSETNFINMSLSSLARVLNARARNERNAPFRDNFLTQFLRSTINEATKILLLGHIDGRVSSLSKDMYTLKLLNEIAPGRRKC